MDAIFPQKLKNEARHFDVTIHQGLNLREELRQVLFCGRGRYIGHLQMSIRTILVFVYRRSL